MAFSSIANSTANCVSINTTIYEGKVLELVLELVNSNSDSVDSNTDTTVGMQSSDNGP